MTQNAFVISACSVRSPRILYGTAWKKTRTEELVRTAIQHGFRGIDTACQPKHYHEAGVGAGVAACLNEGLSRAELYLQTKFTPLSGQDPNQIPYDPSARPARRRNRSSHRSAICRPAISIALFCTRLYATRTKRRKYGKRWKRSSTTGAPSSWDQQLLSPWNTLRPCIAHLESSRPWCRTASMPIQATTARLAHSAATRIIYQSFWTLTANPRVLVHDTVKALASESGRTPAQVLFRSRPTKTLSR